MPALRTLIVDDESLARRGLRLRLLEYAELEIVGECSNGLEALQQVAEQQPNLILLDIQMPGMDGFDVVRRLQADTMPMVIFVTAFDEYAIAAFDINAVDYILKPVDEERLAAAIQRALQQHDQQTLAVQKQKLVELIMNMTGADAGKVDALAEGELSDWPSTINIRDGDEVHRVDVTEIDWIDAAGDYMCVHVGEQTHIMRSTMKQLESLLNPEHFVRVHRSTMVNSDRIRHYRHLSNGEYLLTLEGDTQIKVSRSYRDRIKNLARQAAG